MTYGRTNFDLKEARPLETLAFRFLGEMLTIHVNHRRGEHDIMDQDHIYPLTIGEALGFKVFFIGHTYAYDEFEGKVVAVLFDFGEEAGPILVVSSPEHKPHRAEVLRRLGIEADGSKDPVKVFCLYDKSVGGVPYYLTDDGVEYLVIRSVLGHYCFPKGHVEAGESEEGTGLREIWEETGLQVELLPGFKYTVSYKIPPAYQKEVVYFLARCRNKALKLQKTEVSDAVLLPFEAALAKLTYKNDQDLLRAAHQKLVAYYKL